MQVSIPKVVLGLTGLTCDEKFVLIALLEYGEENPSNRRIGELIGRGLRMVEKAIAVLRGKGFIREVARLQNRVACYRVAMDEIFKESHRQETEKQSPKAPRSIPQLVRDRGSIPQLVRDETPSIPQLVRGESSAHQRSIKDLSTYSTGEQRQQSPAAAPTAGTALLDRFKELHVARFGTAPTFQPGDAEILIALEAERRDDPVTLDRLMVAFFNYEDEWLLKRGYSVRRFRGQMDHLPIRVRDAEEAGKPRETWYEECRRVHDGTCSSRATHHMRVQYPDFGVRH